MKKIFILIFIGLLLVVGVANPPSVRAQTAQEEIGQFLGEAGARSGLGDRDIRLSIALAIGYVLSVLGMIFVVLMLYAGFLWMTAGGEEAKIEKARKLIFNAIVGLVIILSSFAITVFIFRAFVRSTTDDPCYEPLGYQRLITGETLGIQAAQGPIANIFCSR